MASTEQDWQHAYAGAGHTEELVPSQEGSFGAVSHIACVSPPEPNDVGLQEERNRMKQGAEVEMEHYETSLLLRGRSTEKTLVMPLPPVVKPSTARMLPSGAAFKQTQVKHLDAKTVFLHGEIAEELSMEQHPGFFNQTRERFDQVACACFVIPSATENRMALRYT
ncbi:hypothetical protein JRQ81_017381 [Phrynocephalus forsythii]|uniref:Reverse transcriptase n=1 Tax=Phrynocephalus forsythii TaxID=171643 RepID=A0A9Q0XQ80_9SAUR|nr:hypothetical protein JRQ81_017381 [Phrynocephalus forsythii]